MATISIKKRIEAYCKANGVVIPGGFARTSPSRYAVIRRDSGEPKLVAKTWFKQEDLCYYIEKTLIPELGADFHQSTDLLDFKEDRRMTYTGSNRLAAGETFASAEEDCQGPPGARDLSRSTGPEPTVQAE
jgi:hypothetical protein